MFRLTASMAIFLAVIDMPVWAQDGKVYKSVDKSGKITYSQTPPHGAKSSDKIDARPASRGTAGSGEEYGAYAPDGSAYRYQQQYRLTHPSEQQASAQEQRYAQLRAECNRNRGTDCNNPATLQYMESSNIPRQGRR